MQEPATQTVTSNFFRPGQLAATKVKMPSGRQCERFHRTILNEFYRTTFRKKIYTNLAELQRDADAWVKIYNTERPHQGRWCFGKTPMQTLLDTVELAKEKSDLGKSHQSA